MDGRDQTRIEEAKDQLRAAILFGNWNAARLAFELLEEIDEVVTPLSVLTAAQGCCEFCPADGGRCCVCGMWN
jgi:hypothetical protein